MPQFAAPYEGSSGDTSAFDADLGYSYPYNLPLHPRSPLHGKLITELLKRARNSKAHMSKRYPVWREIERNVTAYVPLDSEEERIKEDDHRKPVRVVVPFSYLMRDVISTYLCATFLDSPYHRYTGMGPEDQLGAMFLEQDVSQQDVRFKNGLAYHVQFNDMLTYGFGAITPTWEVETAFRTKWEPEVYNTPFGSMQSGRMVRSNVEQITCEGNRVHNIDPWKLFPDPNTPLHRVQEAEFVMWLQQDNYTNCLAAEQAGTLFNVKYLASCDGTSSLSNDSDTGREDRYGGTNTRSRNDFSRPIDKLVCYMTLIPSEWGLGTHNYPEKWMFIVAGDKLILQAQPMNLNHRRYPIAIASPQLDGYTSSPISSLEVCFPLQEVADFIYTSRLAAVRKSLNDMFLVNPQMVYMPDVLNPRPGKVIRLRKSAWGQPLDNVLKQLEVRDVTSGHFRDLTTVAEIIERVTGAVDILQGMAPDAGNERTTATQTNNQQAAAVSRLQKVAKLTSIQSMSEMGFFMAEHTQQFKEQASYLKATGQWMQLLAGDLGPSGRMQVMPWDMCVSYDTEIHDGSSPSHNSYGPALKGLFDQALADPELRETYDVTRIFSHLFRLGGVRNIDDFRRVMPPPMSVQAMPNEEAQAQAQAGNIVPLDEYQRSQGAVV